MPKKGAWIAKQVTLKKCDQCGYWVPANLFKYHKKDHKYGNNGRGV